MSTFHQPRAPQAQGPARAGRPRRDHAFVATRPLTHLVRVDTGTA